MTRAYDAVVVGSGPNGLAAAVTLAEHDRRVLVVEAADTPGGGCRTEALTLPGFLHDTCSAIEPLIVASPFFRGAGLERYGLRLRHPAAPLAHPLDDGSAALLRRGVRDTAAGLGPDADAWEQLFAPLERTAALLLEDLLAPLRRPRHPVTLGRFGLSALRSAAKLVRRFSGSRAQALFAGSAAHAMLPLEQPLTAGFGIVLTLLGHVVGWPAPERGAQSVTDALVARLEDLGGALHTGWRVRDVDTLPPAAAVLLDTSAREVGRIAGHRLPPSYRRQLARYRYGMGVFKMDWALDGPVPWTAEEVADAGTVHVGGTFGEIAAAEHAAYHGSVPDRPFIIAAQQSRFDPTRAPAGQHTLWGYCHVPNGCTVDMTERMESQIERFAPGFRGRILARHVRGPAALEAHNPNYVGGDINGGVQDLRQLWTRPARRLVPYTTPDPSLYVCSSATPPGGGVHGMCGWFAAQAALRRAAWSG